MNAKANVGSEPVAIVTGASSGIGLGMTRALLEHGYRVVANSRTISQSKELKMEYVADGIRANTISLGVVATPMHANDDHEALKKLNPARRLVQVSEVVDALMYLQSALMVNGENIRIDGGAHAGAKW
ncbi:MAG TPA: SDR family oxidoreductase [Verrucomicrobiae bacterium]|nr:SDR family oxidoreductase [Verrucomicrobiae bacterium]